MKKSSIIIAIPVLAAMLASCTAKEVAPAIVSVGVNAAQYDTELQEVFLSGDKQSFTAEIEGTDIAVASPTEDMWIIPFIRNGQLVVKVSANEGDAERISHVDLIGAGTKTRLVVRQDYIKYLKFVTDENTIDASDGTYKIPISTNLPSAGIKVSGGAEWITSMTVSDGFLIIQTDANPSSDTEREATVKLAADVSDAKTGTSNHYESSSTVKQIVMSGFPYAIDLTALDLDTYPVYDIFDKTNDIHVARVAREYLYKYDSALDVTYVDGAYTVVYPAFRGGIDYEHGLVAENGGLVSWKASVTSDDRGRDMISHYSDGGKSLTLGTVYVARGSTSVRIESLSAVDEAAVVPVTAEPLVLNDHKEGAADNQGNTVEDYTYAVVKIGTQYWIKDNYKSTRLADGSPIPTPVTKEVWAEAMASPMSVLKPFAVLMSGSTRLFDANSPDNASTRNNYGCLYTYAALVGGEIALPEKAAATLKKVDKISPEGWTVPVSSDFEILKSYVIQKSGLSNEATQNELVDKLTAGSSYSNVTGFSAKGTNVVGRSGGYVGGTYYLTMDYTWTGSSHAERLFQVTAKNTTYMYTLAVYHAVYLRLLKK